jgi:uncharacterized membrane protein
MPADLERALERWQKAAVIDATTAERIRSFEQGQSRLRLPAILALAFGGLLLGAGVLLFVAANWDTMSPASRFSLVLFMVAVFHVGGAFAAGRTEGLAITLHGLGTASLGAGIFLSAQIFNLQAHWSSGVLLWAAGAWVGWILRRDWLQLALAAILTPFWLASEWMEVSSGLDSTNFDVLLEGLTLLSITYFCARTPGVDSTPRRVLVWIGGLSVLPCAILLALQHEFQHGGARGETKLLAMGYAGALGVPLIVAFLLRRTMAWTNFVAACWVVVLAILGAESARVGLYLWSALGAVGMVAWGVSEGYSERINIGMAGFAITLLFFYFSTLMDKLGRSASLIGLGLLFLAGGWALEKARRHLVARVRVAK